MAIPFLCEVKHHTALQSLARALEKSSSRTIEPSTTNDNGTSRSYGYHTTIFALTLHDLHRRPVRVDVPTERKLDQHNIAKVLAQCENLQTVRIASVTLDLPLHPTLHRLQSLRSLELDAVSQPLLYNGLKHLERLTIGDSPNAAFRDHTVDFLSFPHLHNLRMCELLDSMMPDWIRRWGIPALKRVTLEMKMDDSIWGLSVASFFTAHGEKIRLLDVSQSATYINLNFLPQTPHLEHLTLFFMVLNEFAAEAHPLTVGNLVKLDVRTSLLDRVVVAPPISTNLTMCMTWLTEIFEPQPRLRIIFRSLEELQMVDLANEELMGIGWTSNLAVWNRWVADCKGIGLKITDRTGAFLEFR
jgi:hypothetical protein